MASPSSVLSLGLGSWGSVNLLPTLGYGVGEAVVVTPGTAKRLAIVGPSQYRYPVIGAETTQHTLTGPENTRKAVTQ